MYLSVPRPQMEEMVTQMWQNFHQQPRGHVEQHTPVYNSQPHHVPPPPTPTLPSVPFYHPTHVPIAHPFPVYSHSLPPAPSPLPYYQPLPPVQVGYPSPYYPSVPHHMYQSLPTPGPTYSESQFLHHLPYPPFSNLNQTLSPSFTQPPTPAPPVPQTASCTQTDLTFLDNPISSPPPLQTHAARRETRPAAGRRSAPIATSILSNPPVIESPLFAQMREQIYSEVASLVSENESRPYYLMELLRVAKLLNTDYLRQTGLNSLKRVINNYLNPDQINPQAFSSFPAPPRPPLPASLSPLSASLSSLSASLSSLPPSLPPDMQLAHPEEEEYVYSSTQNLPLARHYLQTDLSGSSENVDLACVSGGCQLSDAVHQQFTHTSASPCNPMMRRLTSYLLPILRQHLEDNSDAELLTLMQDRVMLLLSALFPEEVSESIYRSLESDLEYMVGRYISQKLRDCDDLFIEIRGILFSSLQNFISNLSL